MPDTDTELAPSAQSRPATRGRGSPKVELGTRASGFQEPICAHTFAAHKGDSMFWVVRDCSARAVQRQHICMLAYNSGMLSAW